MVCAAVGDASSGVPVSAPHDIPIRPQLTLGRASGEIAKELHISVHTVRTHIQGILRTLGAANRLEAVSRALHERII